MSYTDAFTLTLDDLLISTSCCAATGLCNIEKDGAPMQDWMSVIYWWRIRSLLAELPPRKAHKTKEKWCCAVADTVSTGKADPLWGQWYDAACCLWALANDRTPWKPEPFERRGQCPDMGETVRSITGVAKSKYDRSRQDMIKAVADAGAKMDADALAGYLEEVASRLYAGYRYEHVGHLSEGDDAAMQDKVDAVMDVIFAAIAPKSAQYLRLDEHARRK